MTEKLFNINAAGHCIKAKMYFKDIKSVRRAAVCLHGFAGHKDNRAAARFAEHLLKKHKDFAVVTYDAPCHGDDVKKVLKLSDCMTYLELVAGDAAKRFNTRELFAYANSFGGFQVLKFISERENPFEKIALRCPAVNMYEVLSDGIMAPADLKSLERGRPVQVGFDRKVAVNKSFLEELLKSNITARDFTKISEKILILHGTRDEVVPFEVSEEFAAENDILFIPVEDADHRFKDPVKMDLAIKNIIDFFEL